MANMNDMNSSPDENDWFQRIAEAPSLDDALRLAAEEAFLHLSESNRHTICNTPKSKLSIFHFDIGLWIRNRYFFGGPKLSQKFGLDHLMTDVKYSHILDHIWQRLRDENNGRPYEGEAFDPESLTEDNRNDLLRRAKSGDPQAMLEQAMCLFYDSSMSFRIDPDTWQEVETDFYHKQRDNLYQEALRWLQKAEACGGYPRAEYFIGLLQKTIWSYLDHCPDKQEELGLNAVFCRKTALEWLQRAAADGIAMANGDIALLQERCEIAQIPGWRKWIQAKEIFSSLNSANPAFVSVVHHYLIAAEAGDHFSRNQLQYMHKHGELNTEEMEAFSHMTKDDSSSDLLPLPGQEERNFLDDQSCINEQHARKVFQMKPHRKGGLLFEPFCSCDPKYAPPEILALYPSRH